MTIESLPIATHSQTGARGFFFCAVCANSKLHCEEAETPSSFLPRVAGEDEDGGAVNGLNSLNDWNGFSLQPHAIQAVGIFTADLALHVSAHSGGNPLYRLLRIGPCRIAMRVIACPHEVLFSEN